MTGPGAARTRPRWRRLVLAGLPWLAAAALAAAGFAQRGAAPTPLPSAAAIPASPPPSPAPTDGDPPPADALPVLDPELELAVLATARTALGTAGLPLDGPAPDRWPLETRITSIDVTDDVTVVTVAALVIHRRDDHWGAPVVRAVAVPVRHAPPAVLGPAWPVRAPTLALHRPDAHVVDDVDPSLVAALDAAGWLVDEISEVALVGSHHLRVTVHGIAPEEEEPASHVVWLRDDPGGPTALPATDAPPDTTPPPDTEETP